MKPRGVVSFLDVGERQSTRLVGSRRRLCQGRFCSLQRWSLFRRVQVQLRARAVQIADFVLAPLRCPRSSSPALFMAYLRPQPNFRSCAGSTTSRSRAAPAPVRASKLKLRQSSVDDRQKGAIVIKRLGMGARATAWPPYRIQCAPSRPHSHPHNPSACDCNTAPMSQCCAEVDKEVT